MAGVWHKIRFGDNAFLKTNVAFSGTNNSDRNDSLDYNFIAYRQYEEEFIQKRLTISSTYTHKLSAKDNLRAGVIYNRMGYKLTNRAVDGGSMIDILNEADATGTLQGFFQFSHKFSDKFTMNAGAHYVHLLLNNTNSVEPRLSMRYKPSPRQSISLGYGLHGQVQPLGAYFSKVENELGVMEQPNKDLGMNKAHHIVLGYDLVLNESHKIHAEVYYQHLYNIAVSAGEDSTFSLLNDEYGFASTALESSGLGRNYGFELTFERSLKNDLYYLVSTSLFESKYQALNGKWYDTRYNTKYAVSVTGGKDWTSRNPDKRRTLGVNVKSVLTGGLRYTPYDMNNMTGEYPERDFAKSYSEDMPAYYRLDLRISLKRDYKKVTSTVALDLQNVLNTQNPGGQYFDTETGEAKYWYHPGLLPILSYRLTF